MTTSDPWPLDDLRLRGIRLGEQVDPQEFCARITDCLQQAVGHCLQITQTRAAVDEFERAIDSGTEAALAWFARQAPTYRHTVAQVRDMVVADLVEMSEDGVLDDTELPASPSDDGLAKALWWRGVRPGPEEALQLAGAIRARARETAQVPDLGVERAEVVAAVRRRELPYAGLQELDRRLAAAYEEAIMERVRWWADEVCREEWAALGLG